MLDIFVPLQSSLMTRATIMLTSKALSSLTLSSTSSSATYITAKKDPTKSQGYTNTFPSLLPEIKHAIFCSLPDVASLKALILTCSSFYYTFLNTQSLVLKEIIRNQISADMISLAFVLSRSCDLRPWSRAGVLDFLSHFPGYRAPILWTLPRALLVSELHSHIKFFAADFAATKLAGEASQGHPYTKSIVSSVHSFFSSCIVTCSVHANLPTRIASVLKSSGIRSSRCSRLGRVSN